MFVGGILVGSLLAAAGFSLYLKGQKATRGGQSQMVLKLGHGLDTGHPVHKAMEKGAGRDSVHFLLLARFTTSSYLVPADPLKPFPLCSGSRKFSPATNLFLHPLPVIVDRE